MWGPIDGWGGCHWWGMSHIISVPPGWFEDDVGVGHSLAMWPYPWHLKHWRECGSLHLAGPFPCIGPMVVVITTLTSCALHPHSVGRLWAGICSPGLPLPLWEFGELGVLLPLCPCLWPHSQGLHRALEDHFPVQSGSGQPSIWKSADSAQMCPPPGWMSLQP